MVGRDSDNIMNAAGGPAMKVEEVDPNILFDEYSERTHPKFRINKSRQSLDSLCHR